MFDITDQVLKQNNSNASTIGKILRVFTVTPLAPSLLGQSKIINSHVYDDSFHLRMMQDNQARLISNNLINKNAQPYGYGEVKHIFAKRTWLKIFGSLKVTDEHRQNVVNHSRCTS